MNGQHPQPRHCVIANCSHYAATGSVVCWHHRKTRTGRKWDNIVRQAVQDAGSAIEDGDDSAAAESFRRRLTNGEYRELFDAPLSRILNQAAEQRTLDDEIGAIRFALARILAEETDPRHLALAVARLSRASVATSRERRESTPPPANPLTEAMTKILAELDAEDQAKEGLDPEPSFAPLPYREDEVS
jgi:hypothetical protein